MQSKVEQIMKEAAEIKAAWEALLTDQLDETQYKI
jgi:hypothetical protein